VPESAPTSEMQFPGRPAAAPLRLTPDELTSVIAAIDKKLWGIAHQACRGRRRQRPDVDVIYNYILFAVDRDIGPGFDDGYGDALRPREDRFLSYVRRACLRVAWDAIDREYPSTEVPTDGGEAAAWVAAPSVAVAPEAWEVMLAVCSPLERVVLNGLRDGKGLGEIAADTGFPVARLEAERESGYAAVRAAVGIDAG